MNAAKRSQWRLPRWLQRRRNRVFAVILSVLFAVLVVLFHPDAQTALARRYVPPLVDVFTLERIHLRPWAVTVDGLEVAHQGLRVAVPHADIGLAPWRLLFDVAVIDRLQVEEFVVDLRELPPGEESTEPFPGLFALLDQDLGLVFDEVVVYGEILIAPELHADVVARGGGIAPEAAGALELDVTVHQDGDGSMVEITGPVSVAQDADERFTRLAADLLALVQSPELPQEELIEIQIAFTPLEKIEEVADSGPPAARLAGDRFEFALAKPGANAELVSLEGRGEFDADVQRVEGTFDFLTHDGVVAAYLPEVVMPSFEERAEGRFALDLDSGSTMLDYAGDMKIAGLERLLGDNDALPKALHWLNTFSATFDATTLVLSELESALEDDKGEALFSFALTEPLPIPIAEPTTVLDRSSTLARLAIGTLPITWLNGFLPEPVLRAGSVGGAFELRSGDAALTMAPTAAFGASAVRFGERVALDDAITVDGEPTIRFHDGKLTLAVEGFKLRLGERELVDLDVDGSLPLTTEDSPAPRLRLAGRIDVDGILALPPVAEQLSEHTVPPNLTANIDTDLSLGPARVDWRELEFTLGRPDQTPIIRASALAPFAVALGGEQADWRLGDGELIALAVRGFDLAWVGPYLPDLSLSGTLADAAFKLSRTTDGTLLLRADGPLALRDVGVRAQGETLIDDLALATRADVDYTPDGATLRYRDLDVRVGRAGLASGAGQLDVPLGDAAGGPVAARGQLEVNVATLSQMPALAALGGEGRPQRRWLLSLDYDVAGNAEQVTASALDAALRVDDRRHVHVRSSAPVTWRASRELGEDLARHLSGAVAVTIDDLSSTILADLLTVGGLEFDSLSGHASLESDGRELAVDASDALTLRGARLMGEDGALIEAFDLSASGHVGIRGETIEAAIAGLNLTFAARPTEPALAGELAFTLVPTRGVPLERLKAELRGSLPALFDQPVLLPGHELAAGRLALDASVSPDGSITARARVDELVADEPLAITDFDGDATGAMAPDGSGFGFDMRVVGNGHTGQTDGLLEATFDPDSETGSLLELDFTSERFLLNDVLAAIESIRAKPGAQASPAPDRKAPAGAPVRPDREPDARPFWDVQPYRARLAYHIRDLYYTDYVVFNDVTGTVSIEPQRLGLSELSGRFHDSPLDFDGSLAFTPDTPQPYALAFTGKVADFDLNQFFTELVPGDKPRVEGLFSIDLDADGTAPNMGQFRNELLFDMRLVSRDGLFRPLPPGSGLLAGASDVLGVIGEGLSYAPTGGFGAGALSRLINYIALIDYDLIDIHVVRDDSRDIVIERFLARSPTVSLKAHGGIDYEEGKDILDSPLTLDAHLDMSGKGAAILYSMDLLEDEQDEQGYFKGPAFRIRGTPADAESNLEEILTAAADGTVKGGVTRPIAGLIGNIRYRWFGEEPEPYQDSETTATENEPSR